MNHFFGYAKVPQDPENVTGFFEYDGSDDELNRSYMGWRQQNEDMVNWVCQLTDEDLANYRYQTSDPQKSVPIIKFLDAGKAFRASKHYYEKKLYDGQVTVNID